MASAAEVPDGFPIHVVCKVFPAQVTLGKAKKPDDLAVEGNKTLVQTTDGGDAQRYNCDYVYDVDQTEQDIYQRTLVPALNAFLDGVSGCILLFGSVKAQRQELFQGDSANPGLVAKIIDALFVGLQRKHKALAERSKGAVEYRVSFTFAEVYGEVVQDLMNSQNRDLPLVEDPVEGMRAEGLTISGPHNSSMSMIAAFRAGCAARSTTASDFGPASYYASCVLRVSLFQEIKSPRGKSSFLADSLTIANIAGAEKLAVPDPAALRAAEGPRLNKSTFAFQKLCQALSAGKYAEFMPHEDSKLTLMLKEPFGGNCFTRAIMTVAQANPPTNAVMDVARNLRRGVVYPIVMDTVAQGLLRRLRKETSGLRSQLAKAQTGRVTEERRTAGADADLMLRVSELEGNAIKHNLETLKLTEDRDKLYEKFKQFRDKYNQLVRGKAEVQAALIHSEEGKLKVSKALLDLQIENNQLKEAVDKEKFDLGARVMTAENDTVEMEMKYQAEHEKVGQLKAQIEEMVNEKKEIAVELVSLRTNLLARTNELKNERTKTDELSEHILTLANTKTVLERQVEDMKTAGGSASELHEQHEREMQIVRREFTAMENKIKELTETLDTVNAERIKAELTAQQSEVEFNKRKVEVERTLQDYTKNLDTEILRERERGAQEVEQLAVYRETMEKKVKTLESSIRPLQRKIEQLTADLSERDRSDHASKSKVDALESAVQETREAHRSKLLATLNEGEATGDDARQRIINELMRSYHDAEQETTEALHKLRAENHVLTTNNRKLLSTVRGLRNHFADVNPEEAERAELGDISAIEAAAAPSALEAKLKAEAESANSNIERLHDQLNREKEDHVRTAEEHRKKVVRMTKQIDELKTKLQASDAELARLRESGVMDEDTLSKLKNMAEQGKTPRDKDSEEINSLRTENRELRAENQALRDRVSALGEELRQAQDAVAAAESKGARRRTSVVVTAQAQDRDGADESTLLGQLQASEQRGVQLLTRNTVLEEEVTNYKKYMKTQIKKYQKEISKLKKQLAAAKKG